MKMVSRTRLNVTFIRTFSALLLFGNIKTQQNKTLLKYRIQKKDNMFRPFFYCKAFIRSDMES